MLTSESEYPSFCHQHCKWLQMTLSTWTPCRVRPTKRQKISYQHEQYQYMQIALKNECKKKTTLNILITNIKKMVTTYQIPLDQTLNENNWKGSRNSWYILNIFMNENSKTILKKETPANSLPRYHYLSYCRMV
jgi:hypothetical protein